MTTPVVRSKKSILSRVAHWSALAAVYAGLSVSSLEAADLNVTTLSDTGTGSYRTQLSVANVGDNLVFDSLVSGSTLANGSPLVFTKSVNLLNNAGSAITLTDPHAYQIGAPLTVNWGGTLNLTGNLSDNGGTPGSLVMNSPGTLTLSGNNSYSGGTIFEGGTLKLLSNNALGTGKLTVNDLTTTTLVLGNGVQINNNIQLQSPLIINIASGSTGGINGIISESGGSNGLNLEGAGGLIFSGANTFSGGIYVGGNNTIFVDNSAALGTGLLTVAGGLTLDLANGVNAANNVKLEDNLGVNVNSGIATLSGVISETVSSSLTKTGAGTLVLSGNDSYTGITSIQQGTLSVTGTITSAPTVAHGATLMGTGTVGSVTNDGIVQPGNSAIGNLNVNGNFTQNADGTTQVIVNSSGNSPGVNNGHLTVSGTANLDGTLNVIAVGGGNFNTGLKYTILNTTGAGGVSGTYSTVTSNLSLYSVGVTYDPKDVKIQLIQTGSLVNSAVTNNQFAVANSLQNLSLTSSGALFNMINTLGYETTAQQQQAYNQLSGEQYGDTQTLALQSGDVFQQRIVNRIYTSEVFLGSQPGISLNSNSLSNDDARSQSPTSNKGGWIQGYGLGGHIQSDNNGAGLSFSQAGGVYGLDLASDETGMIGVVMGNSYVGYHDGYGGGGQVTSYQAGLYALKQNDMAYVLGSANYAYDNFSSNRNVLIGGIDQTLRGAYLGHQLGANVETGLKVDAIWFQVQPLVGLQYLYLAQQGFDETGGPAALNVSAQQASTLRSNLGARFISRPWVGPKGVVWTPYGQTRWAADLLGNNRIVNATINGAPVGGTFTTSGTKLGTNYGIFTKGVQAQFNEHWAMFASIDVFMGTRIHSETGSAGLSYIW